MFLIVLNDSLPKRQPPFPWAELFGDSGGQSGKDAVDVGHTQVSFEKRIDHRRQELVAHGGEAGAADAADEEAGLPAELDEDSDGENPGDVDSPEPVLLRQVVDDDAEIPHEQDDGHVSVVAAGGALNDDGRGVPGEGLRDQRRAEPPRENEQRPLEKVLVLGKPQPDPGEIREAIAHGHPQQHPKEAVALGDGAGVQEEVEDAVIHQHVDYAHHQANKDGHIFLFPEQHQGEHDEERRVQPYIQRRELPPRDDLGH